MKNNLDFRQLIKISEITRIISFDDNWNTNSSIARGIAINSVIDTLDEKNKLVFKQYVAKLSFEATSDLEIAFDKTLLAALRLTEDNVKEFNSKFAQTMETIMQDEHTLAQIEKIASDFDLELIKQTNTPLSYTGEFNNAIVILDIFDNGVNMLWQKLIEIRSLLSHGGIITEERLSAFNLIVCVLSHDESSINMLSNAVSRLTYLNMLDESNELNVVDTALFCGMLAPILKKDLDISSFTKMVGDSIYLNAYSRALIARNEVYEQSLTNIVSTDANTINAALEESFIEGTCINQYISRKMDASFLSIISSGRMGKNSDLPILKKIELECHRSHFSKYSDDYSTASPKERQKKHKVQMNEYRSSKLAAADLNLTDHLVIDYTVNTNFENPNFGDLYYITDNAGDLFYAVLVSMPCDSIIRVPLVIEDGYDVERKNRKFELIKLTKVTNTASSVEKFASLIFPIKHNGEMNKFRSTTDLIHLPLFMLDYCSFSIDGKFPLFTESFKLDSEELNRSLLRKSYLSQLYYQKLIQQTEVELSSFTNEIFVSLAEVSDKVRSLVHSLACSQLSKTYRVKYSGKSFSIERVGRLRNEIAYNVLRDYTSNLLRVGLDATLPGEN